MKSESLRTIASQALAPCPANNISFLGRLICVLLDGGT
jgi:hypothetical protein